MKLSGVSHRQDDFTGTRREKGLRTCLAASGGGHLRQMLDIKQIWSHHDYFVLTEDTSLGRSLAAEHPTCFVAHFALGQAKLGKPILMFSRALKSCFQSLRHVLRMRPQLVISTGAGSTFFAVVWARLFGAKVIIIDSLARVRGPSAFARIAGPVAHLRISQSIEAARSWRDAIGFATIRRVGPFQGRKEPLVFATVGATLPFDRLTTMVREAHRDGHIAEELILQVGDCDPGEEEFRCVQNLEFDEVLDILDRARVVICHGGTGSLVTALKAGCHVIAVPRKHELGEHYDNHQQEITDAFQALGVLHVANTTEELVRALEHVRSAPAQVIERDMSDLIEFVENAIGEWFPARVPAALPKATVGAAR